MKRAWIIVLLCLSLSGLACNLTGSESAPTATVRPTGNSAAGDGLPAVTVLWPPTGSEFVARQEILVYVRATDSVGITRLELRSPTMLLSSIPSAERSGQTEFEAILSWTPTRTGTQDMEVVAYRGQTASTPIPLQVIIRQLARDIVATPLPYGISAPVIPTGGCQVRVDINELRFRAGPGTQFEIMGILQVGEVLSVTGRNAASTWWQASRNGQTVWFSANADYTTNLTDCSAVPEVAASG